MVSFGQDANYGWLGFDVERPALEKLYTDDLMVDLSQWSSVHDDINLVDKFDMPFDEGFCFWPITTKVLGQDSVCGPQLVGNCVPYGSCLANLDRICVEILIDGDAEEPFYPFIPYSYGAGRVLVGNVNWTSHGSIGSWQVKADMEYGLLPCDVEGVPIRSANDMQGSAATNSSWMRSRAIIEKWLPHAKQLTVGVGSQVKSFADLKSVVVDKKMPVTIASNWGFRSKGLDSKYGIVVHTAGGSWAHQMHIRAVFAIKGQWFVYVGNQWGINYHPAIGDGFALGGLVIFAEEFDKWVKDAETFVRGGINGRILRPNFSFI